MIKFIKKLRDYCCYVIWIFNGKKIPVSHIFKQKRILKFAKDYQCKIFVETGTYYGQMIEAVINKFNLIMTVELSIPLYEVNKKKFTNNKNVFLFLGDSSALMPKMINKISSRALFWLDGHYSGVGTAKGQKECPIIAELEAIARHRIKDHLIFIDDARCFNGTNDYPTYDEIKEKLFTINPQYNISISYDCIIAVPFILKS